MEQSLSRLLTETVVKMALKSIKESPERGIRNLIDKALQFSNGRFQKNFFSAAQTMLQNENSAYYGLVRDTVTYTDMKRLYTFGMNLGYNGCTAGARRIRKNEDKMACMIPWTISLQIDAQIFEENRNTYDAFINEGEELGIYTWMIFSLDEARTALSLAEAHPDSAFCVFCEAKNISPEFLDEVTDLYNVMIAVRYEENAADMCSVLRERGLLYSVWYQYEQKDVADIINGDLFAGTQELSPVFTVLIPDTGCNDEVRCLMHQTVRKVRDEQAYRTLVWELQGDCCMVDSIISGDACCICFDSEGNLCDWSRRLEGRHHNLFQSSLSDILISACPKRKIN